MSNSFNRKFDARAHKAFLRAGIADTGTYTGPVDGDTPIGDVRLTIDRAVEMYDGEASQTVVRRDVVSIMREDVESVEGATILIDGDTFTLRSKIEQDESMTTWVVQ